VELLVGMGFARDSVTWAVAQSPSRNFDDALGWVLRADAAVGGGDDAAADGLAQAADDDDDDAFRAARDAKRRQRKAKQQQQQQQRDNEADESLAAPPQLLRVRMSSGDLSTPGRDATPTVDDGEGTPSSSKKSVRFGTVHVRMVPRAIGSGGVPQCGGWALGICPVSPVLNDVDVGSVDTFEKARSSGGRKQPTSHAAHRPHRVRGAGADPASIVASIPQCGVRHCYRRCCRRYCCRRLRACFSVTLRVSMPPQEAVFPCTAALLNSAMRWPCVRVQGGSPVLRPLNEAERRSLLVPAFDDEVAARQANTEAMGELEEIRASRACSGCGCHSVIKQIRKMSVKALRKELQLREVCRRRMRRTYVLHADVSEVLCVSARLSCVCRR
jgi:hypothetical protein